MIVADLPPDLRDLIGELIEEDVLKISQGLL
jgi:hypothetical protein